MSEKGHKNKTLYLFWGSLSLMFFVVVSLVSVKKGVGEGKDPPPKDERGRVMSEMVVLFVDVLLFLLFLFLFLLFLVSRLFFLFSVSSSYFYSS